MPYLEKLCNRGRFRDYVMHLAVTAECKLYGTRSMIRLLFESTALNECFALDLKCFDTCFL